MIHYFNPGHETAVINKSKYYHPPANVLKMQEDLALLPVWYASPNDYVLAKIDIEEIEKLHLSAGKLEFWGLSPQVIHSFEQINSKYSLGLEIPKWKDEYLLLGSRRMAQSCLMYLSDSISDISKSIIPVYFNTIEEIEQYLSESKLRQVLKTPFSSSGRGLLWLSPQELSRSERQIISGMLKKQSEVSLEKALEKKLDFSMHFELKDKEIDFLGYSVFETNSKGAYQKTLLAAQDLLLKEITNFVSPDLLDKVKQLIKDFLSTHYLSIYEGCIGIDMLIYEEDGLFRLNPCVEINMRKSMGYLAIQLQEKHLYPKSKGFFTIEYSKEDNFVSLYDKKLKANFPLEEIEGKIKAGYLSLCPVTKESKYHAYIIVQ